MDAGTGIGPLIDEAATFKCQERVKGAVRAGGQVVCGGNKLAGPGSFFEPTVVRDVALDSELWQLETFGPVAGIAAFSEDADAVRLPLRGPQASLRERLPHAPIGARTRARTAEIAVHEC